MAVQAPQRPSAHASNGNGLRVSPSPKARSIPLVAVGVLVVVGCSLAFALASLRIGDRRSVLAVVRPVSIGTPISSGDLRVVRVAADSDAALIDAAHRGEVIGRVAAVPLVPGSLLSPSHLGRAALLAHGEALVPLALKAGQYPPRLAAGTSVRVLDSGVGTATGTSSGPATNVEVLAVVVDVLQLNAGSSQGTVVSLKLSAGQAGDVVSLAAAGRAVLIEVTP